MGVATGRHDVMIEAFFFDQDHLLRFIADQLGGNPGVKSVETSIILKVAKFSYEWELPPSAMRSSGSGRPIRVPASFDGFALGPEIHLNLVIRSGD